MSKKAIRKGKYNIKGVNQLSERFIKLVENIEGVPDVVQKNAGAIRTDAKNLAPVDTGELKKSIRKYQEFGGMVGRITAYTDYAEYVELGTRKKNAQPFLKPALEKNKPKFKEDMLNTLVEKGKLKKLNESEYIENDN